MFHRSVFNFFCIMFFFLCTSQSAMAITMSFNQYTGAIYNHDIYHNTDGTDDEYEIFGIMDGIPFTNADIDSALGTYSQHTDYPPYGSDDNTYYRGTRVFSEGTNEVSFTTWTGSPGGFSFEAADDPIGVGLGEEFLLGTLTFTNGYWFADEIPSLFTFSISASSSQVYDGAVQTFNGTLNLYTNFGSSPEEDADWFYIPEMPELGSVRVYEQGDGDNVGSVEVWGVFGSLELVGFRNASGGAFLTDSVTSNPNQPVPEPTTILLFCLGLLGVAGRKDNKKKSRGRPT